MNMNEGDIIDCVVIAVGNNDNTFLEPLNKKDINIPIIIKRKLRYKGKYKIKIEKITPNFIIGEVVNEI